MWYSGSKCRRIEVLVKASCKWLKAILASGVRNFGLTSIASKLVEFLLFDNFFLELVEFQDLDLFSLFDFPDFLACSIPFPPIPNPLTLLLPLIFPEVGLLSLFILEADLLLSFPLETGLSGNQVVFNFEVSRAAILLEP